jgi:glycosyltransferase involved in cell wall biosynthesis
MITGIVVTYNTTELIKTSFSSVRKFHPDMKIIIIDGSDNGCKDYVKTLADKNTTVVCCENNIGHGRGMHLGLTLCQTPYAFVFDSDIEMLKSPIESLMSQMNKDVYGVGWICEVGADGFDYGTPNRNHKEKIPYLHPYCMLLNVEQYFKFNTFVHHGAPCYKAMVDIYRNGLSKKMLIQSKVLTGHTSGQGMNWKGKPNDYIRHDFGGTRTINRLSGKKEVEGQWEY